MSTLQFSRANNHLRRGGVWDYVSPSRLNLWLKCPLAFRLKYIDGLVTPTGANQFLGRVVHRALETYYRHRQVGSLLCPAAVTTDLVDSWGKQAADDGVAFEDQAEEAACRKQAVDLVTAYLSQIPAREPRPLAVEASLQAPLVDPVTGEDLGIPLIGILDLVLDEEEGPLIVDFKTAARGGEILEVTHEIQLSSYSYLFRHGSTQAEGALEIRSLIKTKMAKIETHRYAQRTEQHFGRLFAVIRAYLDDLDRGRFIYRPGLMCAACEYCEAQCRHWDGA